MSKNKRLPESRWSKIYKKTDSYKRKKMIKETLPPPPQPDNSYGINALEFCKYLHDNFSQETFDKIITTMIEDKLEQELL